MISPDTFRLNCVWFFKFKSWLTVNMAVLAHPDSTDHLYNLRSPYVADMPEELRQWCLNQSSDTARIGRGESCRMADDFMEWTLTGYGKDGQKLWRENVPVKMPWSGERPRY